MEEVTRESIYGLMIAIERIQEVLFANRLVEPTTLARKYDEEAKQYRAAGRAELADTLQMLIDRLNDPTRSAQRYLLRAKPSGEA